LTLDSWKVTKVNENHQDISGKIYVQAKKLKGGIGGNMSNNKSKKTCWVDHEYKMLYCCEEKKKHGGTRKAWM